MTGLARVLCRDNNKKTQIVQVWLLGLHGPTVQSGELARAVLLSPEVTRTGVVRTRETCEAALSEAGGQTAPWGVAGMEKSEDV